MINITIDKGLDFGEELNSGLLKPRDELFQKFWKNNNLNPIVGRKLIEIADEVIKKPGFGR